MYVYTYIDLSLSMYIYIYIYRDIHISTMITGPARPGGRGPPRAPAAARGPRHIDTYIRNPTSYYGISYYRNRCVCVGFTLEIVDPKNNIVAELETHLGQSIPML